MTGFLIGVFLMYVVAAFGMNAYKRTLALKGDNHNNPNAGSNIEFIDGKPYAILPESDYVDMLIGGEKNK